MGTHGRTQRSHDELHPLVYKTVAGLTLWLVLSIWVLFSGASYTSLNLSVITFFFLILLAIPTLLWMTWRRNADDVSDDTEAFREWIAASFSAGNGKLSGREAALQILLPIAGAAFGMTIFGLVFYFAVPQPY